MKKIIIFSALIAGLFSACDLDRSPSDAYTQNQIEKDKEGSIPILLNGCYAQLKDWADVMHRVGEYPSDNIMIRGTSSDSFYDFIDYNHKSNNGRLYTFWNNSYKIITQTSELIKLIQEGENKDLDNQLGEAYYMRGMCYFYLCRVFGRPYSQSPETNLGVPIINNGIPKDPNKIEVPDRSTVKDTYDQAISDLKKAESLMTKNIGAAYASKEAAQAMLSRVYLYMSGTYDNPVTEYAQSAIEYADKVINSGLYEMVNRGTFMKYNVLPPDGNGQTETIFAVKRISSEFSGGDYFYGIGGMYATIQGVGWGEMYASAKYLDLLRKAGKDKDARWAFIDPQYKKDDNGEKIPSFRFVADLYNAQGVQTGYTYIDEPLQTKPDGSLFIQFQDKNYPLTLVDADENQYSIQYNGKTYIGEKDFQMLLNRVYPMYYILKCSLQDNESHLHSPIISRLAELYLNKAEAFVKLGRYEDARTNLNVVRGRAITGGEYPAGTLTADNAAQLVDEERQLEMAFEAHRGFDVYRNGETMSRRYPGPHDAMEDIPARSTLVIQKIPQKEIDAYAGYGSTLTQNP